MHFQRIKTPNETLEQYFMAFFLRSKPYLFCSNKSFLIRKLKIKEFFDFLFKTSDVYIGTAGKEIKFFCAIVEKESSAIVQFIFGASTIIKDFCEFRDFYKQVNPKIQTFETEINREIKRENLVHFIQRKDPNAIFKLDNQQIHVLWNT